MNIFLLLNECLVITIHAYGLGPGGEYNFLGSIMPQHICIWHLKMSCYTEKQMPLSIAL